MALFALQPKKLRAHYSKDFRRMGRGIEARHHRCQMWWEPHVRCTREFIESVVPQSGEVAVFGAGRLIDIDLRLLLTRCERVHLFDADPACRSAWRSAAGREYGKRVVPHLCDLTEVLDHWTAGLARSYQTKELGSYLEQLKAPLPSWSDERFDGVISLNILGQIPIYWRDRVLNISPEISEPEWDALVVSMGALQSAQARGLAALDRAWSVMITDTEYYFYQVDHTDWRVEPAIFDDYCYDLFRLSAQSRTRVSESWLWHVAPQFIESDLEGAIHRVEARFFTSLKR